MTAPKSTGRQKVGHMMRVRGSIGQHWRPLAGVSLAAALAVPLAGCATAPPTPEWYGSVQYSQHSKVSYPGSLTYTVNNDFTATALDKASVGSVYGTLDETQTNVSSAGCHIASVRWTGAVSGAARIDVATDPAGRPILLTVVPDFGWKIKETTTWTGPAPCASNTSTITTTRSVLNIAIGNPRSTTVKTSGATTVQNASGLPGALRVQWSLARIPLTTNGRSYDIGNGDQLIALSPDETASASTRTPSFSNISGLPKICNYAFVQKISRPCDAYKAVLRVEWLRNKWFLYNAVTHGACGFYVIDSASWRTPIIRPATDNKGLGIAYVSPGRTQLVRTATGTISVTC